MLPYHHPILLLALFFVRALSGATQTEEPDASKCVKGFAEASSLPVDNSTDNAALYKVLPSGVHLFPQVKFLCDGSVQSLKIGLFYTTAVHDFWEKSLRADLLLLPSDGTYRECSNLSLNCLKIEHNLTELVSENNTITNALNPCESKCMRFHKNVILTIPITLSSRKTVKRGDYLGLVVPPRERAFEDALPIMYMGSKYKTPLIALPPGSFVPSAGWEEQLKTSFESKEADEEEDCDCPMPIVLSLVTIFCISLLLCLALSLFVVICKVLRRRNKGKLKLQYLQHSQWTAGSRSQIAGDDFHMYTENADYALVADVVDGAHFSRPLPELPTEDTAESESSYWHPADTEEAIQKQLRENMFPNIVDKLVSLESKLGEGEFGEVYKGLWKVPGKSTPMEVAVKVPKGSLDENRIKVLQETAILGQFSHQRIAQLCGMVTLSNPIMMVMELLPNGDLSDHLKALNCSRKDPDLPKKLLQFCLEIADGMSYLSKKGFIHRDLAARNILLDKDWHCKISDFGMSRDLDGSPYYTTKGGRIPLRWTAPEAVLHGKYNMKSDVWSYGMVMYEIWSLGHKPFEEFTVEEILTALRSAYCQPPPSGCPRDVYEVMVDCWTPTSHDRPDFCSIQTILQKVENEADVIFHDEEGLNVASQLGAPLDEGREMHVELQNKHRNGSQ